MTSNVSAVPTRRSKPPTDLGATLNLELPCSSSVPLRICFGQQLSAVLLIVQELKYPGFAEQQM